MLGRPTNLLVDRTNLDQKSVRSVTSIRTWSERSVSSHLFFLSLLHRFGSFLVIRPSNLAADLTGLDLAADLDPTDLAADLELAANQDLELDQDLKLELDRPDRPAPGWSGWPVGRTNMSGFSNAHNF